MHSHKRSAVNQREVGEDTDSFVDALRNALREDPDVILVGEMRDLESIRFALTLAETGHLVFATLHTNDTSQAVDRMIDVFPGDQQPQIRVQLASSLTAVVHQRLLPRLGGGLVAAYEVLMATSPVRNLVKEGKTSQLRNQIVTGSKDGMNTLGAVAHGAGGRREGVAGGGGGAEPLPAGRAERADRSDSREDPATMSPGPLHVGQGAAASWLRLGRAGAATAGA